MSNKQEDHLAGEVCSVRHKLVFLRFGMLRTFQKAEIVANVCLSILNSHGLGLFAATKREIATILVLLLSKLIREGLPRRRYRADSCCRNNNYRVFVQ